MQYLGGKKRIAKQIAEFLNNNLEVDYYLEPFVGSAAIIEKIKHSNKFAGDKNFYLIALFQALQNGWTPPEKISEEEYQYVRQNKDENKALTAFVGIGCSFSGKWFGGYARDRKTTRNYALNAKNTLLRQLPLIQDVHFELKEYTDWKPDKALIYCDPPYAGTTKYDATGTFNSVSFWNLMRDWSQNNKVYISEYEAPDDFRCVMEINTRTDLKDKSGQMIKRTERLFTK